MPKYEEGSGNLSGDEAHRPDARPGKEIPLCRSSAYQRYHHQAVRGNLSESLSWSTPGFIQLLLEEDMKTYWGGRSRSGWLWWLRQGTPGRLAGGRRLIPFADLLIRPWVARLRGDATITPTCQNDNCWDNAVIQSFFWDYTRVL